MSQHDMNIENQGFPSVRADINNAIQALVENSSGATAPSTTFANQWWYDTTAHQLKIRNNANDAWIVFADIDTSNNFASVLRVDPRTLTELTSLDLANDLLSIWDESTGRAKKLKLETLATRISSGLPTNVRNVIAENDPIDPDHDIAVKPVDAAQPASLVMRDAAGNLTTFLESISTITKRMDATWTPGTGNGGMASGEALTANSVFYLFALSDENGTVFDAGGDSLLTGANLLADASVAAAGHVRATMITPFMTDASGNILPGTFRETVGGGLEFFFDTPIEQFNISSPGTEVLTEYEFPVPPESYPITYIETTVGTSNRRLEIEMQDNDRDEPDVVHNSGGYTQDKLPRFVDHIRVDSSRRLMVGRTQTGGFNGGLLMLIKGFKVKR